MSQTYTVDCFAGTHVAQTDMQNIENNFAALKSNFSGSSAPSNTEQGMNWCDTDDDLMKVRNAADSAWLAYLTGDVSQKLWIYRNDTVEGWAIDSGVTDRVIAIKGGSDAYNVTGGTTAGTWTQPNHTHTFTGDTHNHHWYNFKVDDGHNSHDSAGLQTGITGTVTANAGIIMSTSSDKKLNQDYYTNKVAEAGTTNGNATANTYRPAAAVGTLQYPNIT